LLAILHVYYKKKKKKKKKKEKKKKKRKLFNQQSKNYMNFVLNATQKLKNTND